jgi:transcriptional regulator with XRE-family HTH domain
MNRAALKIGAKIREARRQRRLTLQRVSSKSGLSIGFLSQVERDITRPSLSSLVTIARSLDVPVSAFLHRPDLPNAVSRSQGRGQHPSASDGLSFEQLSTTFPGQLLNAQKLHVPPRHRGSGPSVEGEQVVYVLQGTVRYILDGVIYELEAGDAFHFSSIHAYEISNPTDSPAELISIGTEPFAGSGTQNGALPRQPPINGA